MPDPHTPRLTAPQELSRSLELAFRIRSRRNALVGLWAGERQGLAGKAADDYAEALCAFAVQEASDAALVAKILADFAAAGIQLSPSAVRGEVDRCAGVAALELGGFGGAPDPRAA